MASRGSEAQRFCKRDQPINAYVWRDIYSVGDRSKSACEKEMSTEILQIDTEIEMLDRGTSASLSVGDDRRVVQRVKLCVRERKIKRGHMTACREKHM